MNHRIVSLIIVTSSILWAAATRAFFGDFAAFNQISVTFLIEIQHSDSLTINFTLNLIRYVAFVRSEYICEITQLVNRMIIHFQLRKDTTRHDLITETIVRGTLGYLYY